MSIETWGDALACPACRGVLSLDVFERDATGACRSGVLRCHQCKEWYAVHGGVARLLVPGPLRRDDVRFLQQWGDRIGASAVESRAALGDASASAQVQGTFAYKWARQKQWGLEGETARLMEEWLLPRYGWRDRHDYVRFMRMRTRLLDAGCGLGRETVRMAGANPGAAVLGMDVSSAVDEAVAYAARAGIANATFIQADVLQPPLRRASVDFILSEGVLHHTASTRSAFEALVGLLQPGGQFGFYVYRRKAPLREYADDYIRERMQQLSEDAAWSEMVTLTRLAKALADLKVEVSVPEDVPLLEIRAGRYDVQRLIYNTMFKCYWNDHFTFDENVLVNFDWYVPRYAWRHTKDEVDGWIAAAGLTTVHESMEESGITVRAEARAGC